MGDGELGGRAPEEASNTVAAAESGASVAQHVESSMLPPPQPSASTSSEPPLDANDAAGEALVVTFLQTQESKNVDWTLVSVLEDELKKTLPTWNWGGHEKPITWFKAPERRHKFKVKRGFLFVRLARSTDSPLQAPIRPPPQQGPLPPPRQRPPYASTQMAPPMPNRMAPPTQHGMGPPMQHMPPNMAPHNVYNMQMPRQPPPQWMLAGMRPPMPPMRPPSWPPFAPRPPFGW